MSILDQFVLPVVPNITVVETTDEFLSKFNLFDVSNEALVQSARNIINPQNDPLAIGGVGAIWNVPGNNDVVLKTFSPCARQNRRPFFDIECQNITNDSLIFRIPDTRSKKTKILCPNYMSENLIGMLLYNLLSSHTPSVPRIYNFAIDSSQPTAAEIAGTTDVSVNQNTRNGRISKLRPIIYTSMSRYDDILGQITNLREFIYMQFQVCQFLNVAQKLTKFVHYDLHPGNIMSERRENDTDMFLNCYELDNGKFLYTYFPFSTIVIDYGFARMETKEHIISPKTEVMNRWMDNFEFNPYTDLVMFLYHSITYVFGGSDPISGQAHGQFPNFNGNGNDILERYISILLIQLFNLPINTPVDDILNNYIGPKRNRQSIRFWNDRLGDSNVRISKPSEMLIKIASYIENNIIQNMPALRNHNAILRFLNDNNFYISDYYIKIPNNLIGLPRLFSRFFPKVYLKDKENMTFLNYRVLPDNTALYRNNLSNFNGIIIEHLNTIPTGIIRENPIPGTTNTLPESLNGVPPRTFLDQQISYAYFDQNAVLAAGYHFRFDCCRLDPRNYFQNNKFAAGVCINAGFFQILGNYTPTGFANIGGIHFDNRVPNLFRRFFGYVAISPDTKTLVIGDNFDDAVLFPDNVITVGPILVFNEDIRMTDEMLINERDPDGNFLFKSRTYIAPEDPNAMTFADGVHNSSKILSGELYHAANPNPRSALVITTDGRVVMVKVEGRDSRGVGMDLSQLAQFCRVHLRARHAINLDGGGSSQITWKLPNQDFINITGGAEASKSYLVGSIISLVKD
jgi:hypothetical protein